MSAEHAGRDDIYGGKARRETVARTADAAGVYVVNAVFIITSAAMRVAIEDYISAVIGGKLSEPRYSVAHIMEMAVSIEDLFTADLDCRPYRGEGVIVAVALNGEYFFVRVKHAYILKIVFAVTETDIDICGEVGALKQLMNVMIIPM